MSAFMFYLKHWSAFLKAQRQKIICYFDTNLCLFNPKFDTILCCVVVKTQMFTTSTPRCTNCVRTYHWHNFSSPTHLNVPSLVVTSRGEKPHSATPCRCCRHRWHHQLRCLWCRLCRTQPYPATATTHSHRTPHHAAAAAAEAAANDNGEAMIAAYEGQWVILI